VDRHRRFDYVVLRGERSQNGTKEEDPNELYARLLARLKKIVPEARVDHRWSGQVISTPDGLPTSARMLSSNSLPGFGGNGITFGTVAAIMARDWVMGRKNPWTDLFAVDRKKIKGATGIISEKTRTIRIT